MFKEIKEKAHDEYFMQMHSFWVCGFLGVCVDFSVPSMRLNNWDWSLNHSLKWVAEVEKRSEKVGGLHVASESLSLWYDSRVMRVFQLNPRTQGWGFCKEMEKEGYIKDAFVCRHPLVERTLSELQIY